MPRYEQAGVQPIQGPNGIIGALSRHNAYVKAEREVQLAKATIADPNATPIQKAMALASIGQEKLGTEVYKKSANESLIGGIEEKLNQRLGRGGAPASQGGTTPIRSNEPVTQNQNVAPTTAQPGAEGTPTQRPFTVNGPANASRNATAQIMQGIDQNYNPYASQQQPQAIQGAQQGTPQQQPQQIDPQQQLLNEADAYDQAASEAAKIGNVALQKDYQDKANQRREDVRQKQQFNQKLQVKDIDAIRAEVKPYTNTQDLEKNVADLKRAVQLIDTGKVSLDSNFLRNVTMGILEGKNHSELAELLKTPEQQELFSLLRKSLKPKQEGGSNPSTREILISMSSIPNPYKGTQANRFLAENLLNEAVLNVEKSKAMKRFAKEKGISYEQWQEKVDEYIAPMQQEMNSKLKFKYDIESAKTNIIGKSPSPGMTFMMAPDGSVREVRMQDIASSKQSGGVLLK